MDFIRIASIANLLLSQALTATRRTLNYRHIRQEKKQIKYYEP